MPVTEFQWKPTRLAYLEIGLDTTQADIDDLFRLLNVAPPGSPPPDSSVDVTWDEATHTLRIVQTGYGLTLLDVSMEPDAGNVVTVVRQYQAGVFVSATLGGLFGPAAGLRAWPGAVAIDPV